MTPRDLEQFLPLLKSVFGVAIFVTYTKPENARTRMFWVAIVALVAIALVGLRPFIANPNPMDDWASFGSLFQAGFNIAVAAVLVLRHRLYGAPAA